MILSKRERPCPYAYGRKKAPGKPGINYSGGVVWGKTIAVPPNKQKSYCCRIGTVYPGKVLLLQLQSISGQEKSHATEVGFLAWLDSSKK